MSRLFATLAVNVILTFQDSPQAFYDAEVSVPLIAGLNEAQLVDVEVDVVRQIIDQYDGSHRDELVKISLCYVRDAAQSQTYQFLVDHLTRNKAKYYFQPNQRDDIENRIANATGIAIHVKDFA